MSTNTVLKRSAITIVGFLAVYALFFSFAALSLASTDTWFKGANIVPVTPTTFSSDNFKQSLQNLKADGANYVALVVPYYQTNVTSSDIAPGWNTPTDASIVSAIQYAHSIGLQVAIKIFDEPYTGEWRAYINPSNRTTWYKTYGDILVHLAQIGQANNAEMMVLGTEMISTASSKMNSDNTKQWQNMITRVRAVYSGKLTYGANSNGNNNNTFDNEKKFIGFWPQLDYVGLSTYYELQGTNVDSLKSSWDYWNKNDLKQFQQNVGKPLIFTEIGYRSVDGSHTDPWNSGRSGNYNATEQSNDYEALMSYWNDYPYMQGVLWWDWSDNPNAGGNGDITYTPQHKPAEAIMKKWFTTIATTTPPPPNNPPATTTPPTTQPPPPINPTPGNPPPTNGLYPTDIWWPANNAGVSGLQPFKAMLQGLDVSQYQMFWQVDGDRLNAMNNNQQDYPHKESDVDLTGWNWKGAGPYQINFVSKDSTGTVVGQKSVNIWVQ